ncbi:DNA cytosine methyltransferase [Paracoccus yeei]|uniref:DNA cytosine methyltransferase n=1 Tax=Paracoccus yeei TaxID=147645 RepID=UPI001C8D46B6|nr:DNA cytosine methyltransferase [Paracoccus yeei]MBY0137379.1 DNA cytosine methyltransferase [Paracoccus yeei]
MTRYKLVDLFCGCGGISRGFEWTGRFGTQLGVELEPHPAKAFASNIKNVDGEPSRVFNGDIGRLSQNSSELWKELQSVGISRPGELDVLTGGPPCQGFSRNGVRQYQDEDRTARFYDDPRNHLYKDFLAVVRATRPKLVLVENVREFLNFSQGRFSADLLSWFDELGYEVEYRKVCALDYGVPQKRHRVFFFAVRKDIADATGRGPYFPMLTHGNSGLALDGFAPVRTVRDAISDLPVAPHGKQHQVISYSNREHISALAKQLRGRSDVVHNHVARTLSPKQVERINAVGTGRMKHIDEDLQTASFYGSAYRRLSWDEPALTITTWVYHVGSGRFAHPEEDRGLTMREAARLQTFDDEYVFPALVNPVSQMIGNAVPPLLANAIAGSFIDILDSYYEGQESAQIRRVVG